MIIMADTASDILQNEANQMDIKLVNITTRFQNEEIVGNSEESYKRFYELLNQEEQLPTSSQPAPSSFLELYEQAQKDNEPVLVITVSSKLSGTYNCAELAKSMIDYSDIYVVDSLSATGGHRLLVEYAVKLKEEGLNVEEIYNKLLEVREKVVVYGLPKDLVNLKKGGRISPAIASIGDTLKLKPVLTVIDGVIEKTSMVRGEKAGIKKMIKAFKEDDIDETMPVYIGHSHMIDSANKIKEELNYDKDTTIYEIGPAIGTHVGQGGLILVYLKK